MGVAVLIPCLNEEKTIEKVISDFKTYLPAATIYVCDNHSSDNTSAIAERSGAIVINEPSLGKGNAVRTLLSNIDADCYLLCDGDDTYPAESALTLCRPILNDNVDMVVGDRFGTYFDENKRLFHGFGNRLVRGLVKLFWGETIDVMTGYRALSRKLAKDFPATMNGFETETELTVFALQNGYKIESVPILYRNRPAGSSSKLNTYTDGVRILWAIARLKMTKIASAAIALAINLF